MRATRESTGRYSEVIGGEIGAMLLLLLLLCLAGCGSGATEERTASISQALTQEFTFTLTHIHVGRDGCGGNTEPQIRSLRIDGVELIARRSLPGCAENRTCAINPPISFTVELPADQETVEVTAQLWERDSGLCGSDDQEFRMSLTMDVATGEVISGTASAARAGCGRNRLIEAGATGIKVCNWGFEWTLSDANCDGIDQDDNGVADDAPGSCLMRVAVVPHCFDGDDDAFELAAQEVIGFFRNSLGLGGCPRGVGAVLTLPSEMPGGVPCTPCPTRDDVFNFHDGILDDLANRLDPAEWSAIATLRTC